MNTKPISRRHFLQAALSTVASVSTPFALNLAAMGAAAAQAGPGDYKALVCLFLSGGNDPFNTLLATDPTSWAEYRRLRVTPEYGSIALPAVGSTGGVLPITPSGNQGGRSFALHPSLGAVRDLFESGQAAVIANVGPLLAPTTLAQYRAGSVPLPPKLFSHNDQSSLWQAYAPEGARFGWGGRMAELLASSNTDPTFTSISLAGNTVFLAGQQLAQYQLSEQGAIAIRNLGGDLFGAKGSANPLRAIVTGEGSNAFEKEHAKVLRRSIEAQEVIARAMGSIGTIPSPTLYINPNNGLAAINPLAVQLQTVARVIAARQALGAKRQVFFVNLPGFDTHDMQKTAHADLLTKLAHGIAYFNQVLGNLQGSDMREQVTTFTASDFGRTFTSNGDGTDHGWGSHHFVFGSSVNGRAIYGNVPVTGLGHAWDVGSGSLLPTLAVDQYAATLAAWFGLSASQINDVFPNLYRFSGNNLGFMKAEG